MAQRRPRADHQGPHRSVFEKNREIVRKTQTICAICGQPVDKRLKWPHPMAATVDHIIPINKGGHPSDLSNLQLAHFRCNRQKWDRLAVSEQNFETQTNLITNRDLPQTLDWKSYRSKR